MSQEIVVNRCFGGFSLSKKAAEWLGLKWDGYGCYEYYRSSDNGRNHRDDAKLIACLKALKKEANGRFAALKIIKIPDGIDWYIDDYDGFECVRERGHCWPKEDEE